VAVDDAALALQDCGLMDAMPFDADYDSDLDFQALNLQAAGSAGGNPLDSDDEVDRVI
jgi:hypothetical protein